MGTPLEIWEIDLLKPLFSCYTIQMNDQPEPQMDPILEECYRIKAEFSAQFNSLEELYDYLKAREKEGEAQGRVYIDPPPPPAERHK